MAHSDFYGIWNLTLADGKGLMVVFSERNKESSYIHLSQWSVIWVDGFASYEKATDSMLFQLENDYNNEDRVFIFSLHDDLLKLKVKPTTGGGEPPALPNPPIVITGSGKRA